MTSTDDPTLPGTPRAHRSSTDVDISEVREGLAVRRGMSIQSLRAIEQLEPVLRELRQATTIQSLRAIEQGGPP